MKVERPRARSSLAPNAAEQLAHHANFGPRCRHIRPHLGQHRDQRVLSEKRRFTRHIRPGQKPDILLLAQAAIIGNKRRAPCARNACSTTGCRPPSIISLRLSSTFGRAQSSPFARSASADVRSSSASPRAAPNKRSETSRIDVLSWNRAAFRSRLPAPRRSISWSPSHSEAPW